MDDDSTISESAGVAGGEPVGVRDHNDQHSLVHHALHEGAHLLPSQAPLHAFVHHNTLHAFESLHFEEAVLKGTETFGAEPYYLEERFHAALAAGRIQPRDIEAVVEEEISALDEPLFEGGPSRRRFYVSRLLNLAELPTPGALTWWMTETTALTAFHSGADAAAKASILGGGLAEGDALRRIFDAVRGVAVPRRRHLEPPKVRPRDRVLAATGRDPDEHVHPLLIRLGASFLDQGIAYWSMPERERGLLEATRSLYGSGGGMFPAWAKALPGELAEQARLKLTAEDTIIRALYAMQVPQSEWEHVIVRSLLALPGYAGMMLHLEERPDKAPVKAPPARLIDFLAVRLTLDAIAARFVVDELLDKRVAFKDLARAEPAKQDDDAISVEAFLAAQWAGVAPGVLERDGVASAFLAAVVNLDELERRRLLHLAYERRHRVQILDAMVARAKDPAPAPAPIPAFQAFFCIDEREESLRRHLEEGFPNVQTFGFAGFFGIPMAYQGVEDTHPTPLCPVTIRPRHLVREVPVDVETTSVASSSNPRVGAILHAGNVGSRTLIRGSVLTATIGMLSVVPLVGRTLFPRLTERLAHRLRKRAVGRQEKTRLSLVRSSKGDGSEPDAKGYLHGFTPEEMADIVASVLRTCPLTRGFAPLVFVIGHGSSSLNNPHEAAHDCGACGGGRGGPNGRAFALMANHPAVRIILEGRGITIPAETVFVGGYHNTADDAVDLYDLDLVPSSHQPDLERAIRAFDEARARDAQERARRFVHAPENPEQALAHVEARSVDLAQPRPEYGHATNAVCVVGRRALTRGLFLDRRAFLVSYDPSEDDDEASVLSALLQSVGPVGAGINLEYYFSFIDNQRFGCGTKLPHNITSLLGVMDGHASDLRTGLPWQMVEIHEPVRLLTIVEAEPETLAKIAGERPAVGQLVAGEWIQLVAFSPSRKQMFVYRRGGFVPHEPEQSALEWVSASSDYYLGHVGHLPPVGISAEGGRAAGGSR